jgi:hypothetical protein
LRRGDWSLLRHRERLFNGRRSDLGGLVWHNNRCRGRRLRNHCGLDWGHGRRNSFYLRSRREGHGGRGWSSFDDNHRCDSGSRCFGRGWWSWWRVELGVSFLELIL